MKKDKRLEYLSNEVRRGHSIDFSEALEVIEYQGKLREARKIAPIFERLFSRSF